MRTAVSRLFTFCPPGPPERATDMSSSLSGMCVSGRSGSFGRTSTSENEVCRFPAELNGDMRTKRCTPASCFKAPYAPEPSTSNEMLRNPPIEFSLDESNPVFQPLAAAYFLYISKRMREKSSASSPPAPEIIVTSASLLSYPPPPASFTFRSWYSLSSACALSLFVQKSGSPICTSISAMRVAITSLDCIQRV